MYNLSIKYHYFLYISIYIFPSHIYNSKRFVIIDTIMDKKLVIFILCLIPVFFLPTTQNYYDTNKWMILTAGALCVLIFQAIALLRVKTPVHAAMPHSALGFGVLTLASIIGLMATSTNKVEALLSPLGPLTLAAFTILVGAGSSMTKQEKIYLRWTLFAVTGLLGIIAFYQALGMGKLMFPWVSFLADPLWTPTGSVTTTLAFFFISLSLLIPDTVAAFRKHHDLGTAAILTIGCIVTGIGAIVTIVQFVPKISGGMLPFDAGMVTASQVFKNPLAAAAGVGAENFISAFTMARPVSFNTSPLAGVVFATNADFFLHILTVYGLLGLGAGILLTITLFQGADTGWLFITKCLCVAGLLLIPPSIALLAGVAVVIILVQGDSPSRPLHAAPWIRIPAGVILLLVTAVSFYFLTRAYTAEVYFFRSLRAAQNNDGATTYNQQIRAIRANTFLSRYHVSYSQTSLSLANSIASSKSVTEQDHQLVVQLVQQAVKEAKTAVSLNAKNVGAWENLGLTYQTIIPVATEAAGWAVTVYQTAVTMDPSNPTLFVNTGSVFVTQKKYDNAIGLFQRAIQLNPSYANAYYNLANAYRLKGDTVKAASTLTDTLKLVPAESTDYYKIKNELEALQQQ